MKRIPLAAIAMWIATSPAVAQTQSVPSNPPGQKGSAPDRSTSLKSLGLKQYTWNAQLRIRGESQRPPGYLRYLYNEEDVFPIRTRDGMITTIKLPQGMRVSQAYVADERSFQVGIPTPMSVAVRAVGPGRDTIVTVFTWEGHVLEFYLCSAGYDSKAISDILVEIVLPDRGQGKAAVDEGYVPAVATDQAKAKAGDPRTSVSVDTLPPARAGSPDL